MTDNSPHWGITFYGVLYACGTAVPIDTKLKFHTIHAILEHADCNWIFVSKTLHQLLLEALSGSRLRPAIFIIDDQSTQFLSPVPQGETQIPSHVTEKPSADDLALLLYTSGTTAEPKGVMLTHGNIASNVESVCSLFPFSRVDRFFAVLPLCHTYAITADFLIPLYIGATITYLGTPIGPTLVEEMHENNTTVFITVPAILEVILHGILHKIRSSAQHKRILFKIMKSLSMLGQHLHIPLSRILFKKLRNKLSPNLRLFVSGGAPLAPQIIQYFALFGIPIYQGYGLTETSPILNVNYPGQNVIGSVGKAIPGVQIKIVDAEIVARGPNIMKGYYNNKAATEEVIKGGWFHTGDLGYIDRNGFLFISGRAKNLIVSRGGKNIYPEEIESEINQSPLIKESCVLGLLRERKDHGSDEQVYVLVIPNYEYLIANEISTDSEHLQVLVSQSIRAVNNRLADYKHITSFEIWEEFPKTTTQKIKRSEIKKILLQKQSSNHPTTS